MRILVLASGRVGSNWICRILTHYLKKKVIFYNPSHDHRSIPEFMEDYSSNEYIIKAHLPHLNSWLPYLSLNDKIITMTRSIYDVIASVINIDWVITTKDELGLDSRPFDLDFAKEKHLSDSSLRLIIREYMDALSYEDNRLIRVLYESMKHNLHMEMSRVFKFLEIELHCRDISSLFSINNQSERGHAWASKETSANIIVRGSIGQSKIILDNLDIDRIDSYVQMYDMGEI